MCSCVDVSGLVSGQAPVTRLVRSSAVALGRVGPRPALVSVPAAVRYCDHAARSGPAVIADVMQTEPH